MKKVLAMILAAMMALTATICGAAAEDEWKDFNCAEEQFITKVPDGAVFLSKYAIRMMIAYDFQDQVSLDDLTNWFDNAEDIGDIFTLPGYTLNVYKTDEQLTYAVIPPAEKVPQLQNVQEAEQ